MAAILRIFAFASSLVLVACATPLTEMQDRLTRARTSVSNYEEMPSIPLVAGERIDIELDEDSPAFQFSSGKSFYAAYELPEIDPSQELELVVRSFLLTGFLPNSTVFVPRFAFLDARKRLHSTRDDLTLTWSTTARRYQGAHFVGGVGVPQNARYVVIFTVESNQRLFSRSANGTLRPVRHSPFGSLEVQLAAHPRQR
jgi:hypothetical protein